MWRDKNTQKLRAHPSAAPTPKNWEKKINSFLNIVSKSETQHCDNKISAELAVCWTVVRHNINTSCLSNRGYLRVRFGASSRWKQIWSEDDAGWYFTSALLIGGGYANQTQAKSYHSRCYKLLIALLLQSYECLSQFCMFSVEHNKMLMWIFL